MPNDNSAIRVNSNLFKNVSLNDEKLLDIDDKHYTSPFASSDTDSSENKEHLTSSYSLENSKEQGLSDSLDTKDITFAKTDTNINGNADSNEFNANTQDSINSDSQAFTSDKAQRLDNISFEIEDIKTKVQDESLHSLPENRTNALANDGANDNLAKYQELFENKENEDIEKAQEQIASINQNKSIIEVSSIKKELEKDALHHNSDDNESFTQKLSSMPLFNEISKDELELSDHIEVNDTGTYIYNIKTSKEDEDEKALFDNSLGINNSASELDGYREVRSDYATFENINNTLLDSLKRNTDDDPYFSNTKNEPYAGFNSNIVEEALSENGKALAESFDFTDFRMANERDLIQKDIKSFASDVNHDFENVDSIDNSLNVDEIYRQNKLTDTLDNLSDTTALENMLKESDDSQETLDTKVHSNAISEIKDKIKSIKKTFSFESRAHNNGQNSMTDDKAYKNDLVNKFKDRAELTLNTDENLNTESSQSFNSSPSSTNSFNVGSSNEHKSASDIFASAHAFDENAQGQESNEDFAESNASNTDAFSPKALFESKESDSHFDRENSIVIERQDSLEQAQDSSPEAKKHDINITRDDNIVALRAQEIFGKDNLDDIDNNPHSFNPVNYQRAQNPAQYELNSTDFTTTFENNDANFESNRANFTGAKSISSVDKQDAKTEQRYSSNKEILASDINFENKMVSNLHFNDGSKVDLTADETLDTATQGTSFSVDSVMQDKGFVRDSAKSRSHIDLQKNLVHSALDLSVDNSYDEVNSRPFMQDKRLQSQALDEGFDNLAYKNVNVANNNNDLYNDLAKHNESPKDIAVNDMRYVHPEMESGAKIKGSHYDKQIKESESKEINIAKYNDHESIPFFFKLKLYFRQLFASLFSFTSLRIVFPDLARKLGIAYPSSMPLPFGITALLTTVLGTLIYFFTRDLGITATTVFITNVILTGLTPFDGITHALAIITKRRIDSILSTTTIVVCAMLVVNCYGFIAYNTTPFETITIYVFAHIIAASTAATLVYNLRQPAVDSFGTMNTSGFIVSIFIIVVAAFAIFNVIVAISVLGSVLFSRAAIDLLLHKLRFTASKANVLATMFVTLIAILLDVSLLSVNHNILSPYYVDLVQNSFIYDYFPELFSKI